MSQAADPVPAECRIYERDWLRTPWAVVSRNSNSFYSFRFAGPAERAKNVSHEFGRPVAGTARAYEKAGYAWSWSFDSNIMSTEPSEYLIARPEWTDGMPYIFDLRGSLCPMLKDNRGGPVPELVDEVLLLLANNRDMPSLRSAPVPVKLADFEDSVCRIFDQKYRLRAQLSLRNGQRILQIQEPSKLVAYNDLQLAGGSQALFSNRFNIYSDRTCGVEDTRVRYSLYGPPWNFQAHTQWGYPGATPEDSRNTLGINFFRSKKRPNCENQTNLATDTQEILTYWTQGHLCARWFHVPPPGGIPRANQRPLDTLELFLAIASLTRDIPNPEALK